MKELYAKPKSIENIDDCYFYHTMELPGHGLVKGDWDLRDGVQDYLGHTDFNNKRVLEMGPASGFLTASMEKMGADVVSCDLSPDLSWDIVPYYNNNDTNLATSRKEAIRKLNNSFWFAHERFNSNAKVVYTKIYDIPDEIGPTHISTFGCILLHLRDPFLALQAGLKNTTETVIVTDVAPEKDSGFQFLHGIPEPANRFTWWQMTPEIIIQFASVLGFKSFKVTYHEQICHDNPRRLFTVVGHRK